MAENPRAESCPIILAVQITEIACCCQTESGYGMDVRARVSASATEAKQIIGCQNSCREHETKQFMYVGRCGFKPFN